MSVVTARPTGLQKFCRTYYAPSLWTHVRWPRYWPRWGALCFEGAKMLWPYINVLRTSSCTVILAATSVPPGCKLFVDPPRDVLAKSVQGPWTLWALTVYVRHELTWSRTATQCLTDIVMEHGDPLSVPDPVLRYVCRTPCLFCSRTPPLVPNSQTSKYHCAVSVSCRCQSSFLRTLFHVETSSRSCL